MSQVVQRDRVLAGEAVAWPQPDQERLSAEHLAALDLPLKALIWADGDQTSVSYYAPAELAARHHLTAALAANLAGISALTDALVAS